MRFSFVSRVKPAPGFIEPCLPTLAHKVPIGPDWVYEVKHDGYRLMVRRSGDKVRVYTRRGADWTERFPASTAAAAKLKARSFLLDGEGAVLGKDGVPDFNRLHSRLADAQVVLCAFDLLEHDGVDLRGLPLAERKARLAKLLAKAKPGLNYVEHLVDHGDIVFEHVCKLGMEGVVAKRIDLPYRSGRSRAWLKIRNPKGLAAARIDEGTF